jgi:hypothetical protein
MRQPWKILRFGIAVPDWRDTFRALASPHPMTLK